MSRVSTLFDPQPAVCGTARLIVDGAAGKGVGLRCSVVPLPIMTPSLVF